MLQTVDNDGCGVQVYSAMWYVDSYIVDWTSMDGYCYD